MLALRDEDGAQLLECDVHLSADGQDVILHDATLDRTAQADSPLRTGAVADLTRLGAAPQVVHIANSPAALTRPDLARDLVRPGIAVYGRTPVPARGDFGLIPAMTLTATIALVKKVAAGQGVSYSETWIGPRDTVVAVVAGAAAVSAG